MTVAALNWESVELMVSKWGKGTTYYMWLCPSLCIDAE